MLRFSGTGESHVGLVRSGNEDSAFAGPTCLLVADGVGGGEAGEVASATTAYAVAATVLAETEHTDPAAVLWRAVDAAHAQVAAGVAADAARSGMATTLTAVVTDGRTFALAHLGDSRGYVFSAGVLSRVTRDHTYVQDLLDEGRIGSLDAAQHPWRNVVLRTVDGGGGPADVIALPLGPGDRVLLASDGLTDVVGEDELAEILARRSDDDAVGALVAAALARGGPDNVTCVLGTVVEGPPVVADGMLLGAVRDPRNVVDLGAVRSDSA